jgi:hypothetical protein
MANPQEERVEPRCSKTAVKEAPRKSGGRESKRKRKEQRLGKLGTLKGHPIWLEKKILLTRDNQGISPVISCAFP